MRRVLVFSGLEPTGRAGLLADVSTLQSMGVEPVGIATSLTAQGPDVFCSENVSARLVRRQIRAALALGPVHAVKLGAVPNREILSAIWRGIRALPAVRVVDPVVKTSEGSLLSTLEARDYLRLAARDVVLTPNLNEVAWLLGEPRPHDDDSWIEQAARRLVQSGFGAVVVKGGHRQGRPDDVLVTGSRSWTVRGERRSRDAVKRGTGCRLASAMAAQLAGGKSVRTAVVTAKRHVEEYLD